MAAAGPPGWFYLLFRRRFALAIARLCQGVRSAAIDVGPPLDASLDLDSTAAAIFSRTMRRYSAGEHLFCAISNVRRASVSQDANISSVINSGSDDLRRLLAFIPNVVSQDAALRRELGGCSNLGRSEIARHYDFHELYVIGPIVKAVDDAGPLMHAIASLD